MKPSKIQINKIKVLVLGLLYLPIAYAGVDTSGGGNAVVCFDNNQVAKVLREKNASITSDLIAHVVSVEAFDLYEARLKRGLNPINLKLAPIKPNENFIQYIERVNNRLNFTVPSLGNILSNSRSSFKDSNIIYQDHGLAPINDFNSVGQIDSNRCVVATIAAQYKINNEFFLHLDERLFLHAQHSELSKAVLLLHEYFYLYAREKLIQTDSRNTRILVGKIIQDENYNLLDLIRLAKDLDFVDFEFEAKEKIYASELVNYMVRFEMAWSMQSLFFIGWDRENKFHSDYTYMTNVKLILQELSYKKRINNGDNFWEFENINQAVGIMANLKSKGLFEKLDKPEAADQLLIEMKDYIDAQAQAVYNAINDPAQQKLAQIEKNAFFSPLQKKQIRTMMEYMVDRIVGLAKNTQTKRELDIERQPTPSGMLRFAHEVDIFELNDYKASYRSGAFGGTKEENEKLDELRNKLFKWINANILFSITQINFKAKDSEKFEFRNPPLELF